MMVCRVCKRPHQSESIQICRSCADKHNRQQNLRRSRKREILKSGGCQVCGYNRCIRALSWHHIDPTQKLFAIGHYCAGGDRLSTEIAKCVLLCANCHMEVEEGISIIPLDKPK